MTIEGYKKKFRKLYEEMQEEHGTVKKVVMEDVTEYHRNQMPINADFRIIDCDIYF